MYGRESPSPSASSRRPYRGFRLFRLFQFFPSRWVPRARREGKSFRRRKRRSRASLPSPFVSGHQARTSAPPRAWTRPSRSYVKRSSSRRARRARYKARFAPAPRRARAQPRQPQASPRARSRAPSPRRGRARVPPAPPSPPSGRASSRRPGRSRAPSWRLRRRDPGNARRARRAREATRLAKARSRCGSGGGRGRPGCCADARRLEGTRGPGRRRVSRVFCCRTRAGSPNASGGAGTSGSGCATRGG